MLHLLSPLSVMRYSEQYIADTRCWMNVGLTLVQRRRWWTNVKLTLIQHLVSARLSSRLAVIVNTRGGGGGGTKKQIIYWTYCSYVSLSVIIILFFKYIAFI